MLSMLECAGSAGKVATDDDTWAGLTEWGA